MNSKKDENKGEAGAISIIVRSDCDCEQVDWVQENKPNSRQTHTNIIGIYGLNCCKLNRVSSHSTSSHLTSHVFVIV